MKRTDKANSGPLTQLFKHSFPVLNHQRRPSMHGYERYAAAVLLPQTLSSYHKLLLLVLDRSGKNNATDFAKDVMATVACSFL